ncbi:MAG: SH3 domain-containing protein [Treponema sp.]|jgi:hypothetical protein|nr:SH3 domain-containing protein [Treponema sp.]
MKKILPALLLVLAAFPVSADIIDDLIENKFSEIIRPYGSSRYVGTLTVENDALRLSFESDNGYYPTIMAHGISAERIGLIIKSRAVPAEGAEIPKNALFSTKYYRVELYREEEGIRYSCYQVEEPGLVIEGFTFTGATVNERFVNLRTGPSTESAVYGRLNYGAAVTGCGVSGNSSRVALMSDYWIQITLNDAAYWVYGYYVDFQREIKLK